MELGVGTRCWAVSLAYSGDHEGLWRWQGEDSFLQPHKLSGVGVTGPKPKGLRAMLGPWLQPSVLFLSGGPWQFVEQALLPPGDLK